MNHRKALVAVFVLSLMVVPSARSIAKDSDDPNKSDDTATQLKIVDTVAPSLVRVEYTLQFDKGEAPSGGGLRYRCPNCGNWHGYSGSETVEEERPLEAPGFLLSSTEVIASDMTMHPRFIKSIAVRYADSVVEAKVTGWSKDRSATFLALSEPLAGAKALQFDSKAEGSYHAVIHNQSNGLWTTSVKGLSNIVSIREGGRQFTSGPSCGLIVNEDAVPVGMSMGGELMTDDSWKGSPLAWDMITLKEMNLLLDQIREISGKGILRVALSFRSPKKADSSSSRFGYGDDGGKTEQNALGILVDEKTVLVLVKLKPKVTGRLNRIVVHAHDGQKVNGSFEGTLSNYGAFAVSLEKPLPGAVRMSSEKIINSLGLALLAADVRLQGENRSEYFSHMRIAGYEIGWRRNLYPDVPGAGEERTFLFDENGQLVAFPIARREKASVEDRWSDRDPVLTASSNLGEILAAMAAKRAPGGAEAWARHIDPSNVPLSEAEENRLAWLGVELQPLDQELARLNNVSELSRDGEIGALVSHVYPGSPAEKEGIEMGFILLRLHVEGHPKPLDVQIERYGFGGDMFPWEHLDELPEEYFDRLPTPWPPAENPASRALTDLGFGKKFRAEFFSDGNVIYKDSVVVQSPPHYGAAKKHKSEAIGLTVKNLTYEVRRYFHKTEDEPGVIVAKIEPGSKASVSGIKPYEIITHVNGKDVMNVGDFEKLIADQTMLRLSIKRMTKGRTVRIKLDSASTRPATTAPSEDADEGED